MKWDNVLTLASRDEYLGLLLSDYNKESDGSIKEELFKEIMDYVSETERQKGLKE